MKENCLNCGEKLRGEFCHSCGQNKKVERFSLKYLLTEFLYSFTSTDRSVWSLLKNIFSRPGKLAFEYIVQGKRKRYFNLFTFFLIVIALQAFVEFQLWQLKEDLFVRKNYYGYYFNMYSKYMIIVKVFAIAFVIWLIHKKETNLVYTEYVVYSMILMTIFTLYETITGSICYIYTSSTQKELLLEDNLMYPLITIAFISFINFQFHQPFKVRGWSKSLLTGILFIWVQIVLAMLTIAIFFTKFKGIGVFDMYGVRLSNG